MGRFKNTLVSLPSSQNSIFHISWFVILRHYPLTLPIIVERNSAFVQSKALLLPFPPFIFPIKLFPNKFKIYYNYIIQILYYIHIFSYTYFRDFFPPGNYSEIINYMDIYLSIYLFFSTFDIICVL